MLYINVKKLVLKWFQEQLILIFLKQIISKAHLNSEVALIIVMVYEIHNLKDKVCLTKLLIIAKEHSLL